MSPKSPERVSSSSHANSALKKKKRKSGGGPQHLDDDGQHDGGGGGDDDMIKIRFEENSEPIVCSFPRGLPAGLQQQQEGGSGSQQRQQPAPPKFMWRRLNREEWGRTVVGTDGSCLYSAEASEAEQADLQSRICVGVFDRTTRTLTVHRAASNGIVFAMQQSVPTYDQQATVGTGPGGGGAGPAGRMSSADNKRALFEDFGSSKKRKALKSQEANRVNIDTVVGSGSAMVGSFMQGEAMSESNRQAVQDQQKKQDEDEGGEEGGRPSLASAADEAAKKEFRRKFLPPFHEDAEEPHLVYDAKEIAGTSAWEQVGRVVRVCMRKEANSVADAIMEGPQGSGDGGDNPRPNFRGNEWIGSVKELIYRVSVGNGPTVVDQLKCAVLLNHFSNLYLILHKRRHIPRPSPERRSFFGTPLEVGERFLQEFTVEMVGENGNVGHVMQKVNSDRCCLTILILYIIAEGGKSMKAGNVRGIADDLKIGATNAGNLLREAGFTVQNKSSNSTMAVVLKTPLKFPSGLRKRARSTAR